jgi:F0F1-type ATP synthase assembly protein I
MTPGEADHGERPERTTPGDRKVGSPSKGGDLAGLGFQLAGTIFLFLFVGRWLDGRFDTSPWLTMTFVFAGAGAAFYAMYRKLMAGQKRDAERRKRGER